MNSELHAFNLAESGRRHLHPGCCQALCTSKSTRLTQAFENFQNAGNIFKLHKKYFQAGECFEQCAYIRVEEKEDPAEFYEEAAFCYKFEDKKRSQENINRCLMVYESRGQMSSAGNITMKMAKDFETDGVYTQAIEMYTKAADYFQADKSNQKSNFLNCRTKQADLLCLSDSPNAKDEAKVIYEQVGREYLSITLVKSSAKDLFTKCVVCYLVYDDALSGEAYLSKFSEEDDFLAMSNEYTLLKETIEAMKEDNLPGIQKAVQKYKKTNNLDKWMVHMFTKICDKIKTNEVDGMKGIELDFK